MEVARVVLLDEALLTSPSVASRAASRRYIPADHLAVSQHEQGHRRLVVLARHPDEVELGPREGGHLLALHRPLDRPHLVAEGRRALVLLALGRRGHLGPQGLDEGLLSALEEQFDLFDVGAIVGLRDGLDAGALAALDVVQEARTLEGALPLLDVDRAGPEREQPPTRFIDSSTLTADAYGPKYRLPSLTSFRVRSTAGSRRR